MRISIHNGKYVQYREVSDPHSMLGEPYDTILEYQVYDENGNPISSNYRGEAHVSNGVIVIGDPMYQANLTELRVANEPTFDSAQHFEGFLRAIDEKRKPSSKGLAKYENKSTQWWDGYRDAWEQKDRRKRSKNPSCPTCAQIHDEVATWPHNWQVRFDGFEMTCGTKKAYERVKCEYTHGAKPSRRSCSKYRTNPDAIPANVVQRIDRLENALRDTPCGVAGDARVDATVVDGILWGVVIHLDLEPEQGQCSFQSCDEAISKVALRSLGKDMYFDGTDIGGGERGLFFNLKDHALSERLTEYLDRDEYELIERRVRLASSKVKNPHEVAADFVSRHGGDRTWRQRIPGGTTRPPCEFDRAALAAGLAVELEHTTDPAIALEIAMDHLDEDPRYYAGHAKNAGRRRQRNPCAASSRTERVFRRVRDT